MVASGPHGTPVSFREGAAPSCGRMWLLPGPGPMTGEPGWGWASDLLAPQSGTQWLERPLNENCLVRFFLKIVFVVVLFF